MKSPSVTVAICTWNRAESLQETLSSLRQVVEPEGLVWEVLVVNNNCTDNTASVVAEFSDALPIRAVFEPRAGLSNARNAALEHAAGDYIVWTDDDVTVDRYWLEAYADAFSQYPSAAFFGGKIVPRFLGGTRPWIQAAWNVVKDAYAERDLGSNPFTLSEKALPYGANFATRAGAQLRYRYDPELGNNFGAQVGGEEIALFESMLACGEHGYWIPDSVVYHRIEKWRQSRSYLRQYFRSRGLATAAKHHPHLSSGDDCPLWLYRKWLATELRYLWASLTAGPESWVAEMREAARLSGFIALCRRPR